MSAERNWTIAGLRERKSILQRAVAEAIEQFEQATGLGVVCFDIDRVTRTAENGDDRCVGIEVRASIEPINL